MITSRPSATGLQMALSVLPNHLLLLLSYFAAMHCIHLVYFIVIIQPSDIRPSVVTTYMLCISAGTAAYFFGSSCCLYLPYGHGQEMSPSARFDYMALGVAGNFLLHELPLGWIHIWLAMEYGVVDEFQGIVLVASMISFMLSLSISWFSYAWKVSEVLQRSFSVHSVQELRAFGGHSGGGSAGRLKDWLIARDHHHGDLLEEGGDTLHRI